MRVYKPARLLSPESVFKHGLILKYFGGVIRFVTRKCISASSVLYVIPRIQTHNGRAIRICYFQAKLILLPNEMFVIIWRGVLRAAALFLGRLS